MTDINTRAYSKTHHVFRMLNFNLKMARNPTKIVFLAGSRIQTDGMIFILSTPRLSRSTNINGFPPFRILGLNSKV